MEEIEQRSDNLSSQSDKVSFEKMKNSHFSLK